VKKRDQKFDGNTYFSGDPSSSHHNKIYPAPPVTIATNEDLDEDDNADDEF